MSREEEPEVSQPLGPISPNRSPSSEFIFPCQQSSAPGNDELVMSPCQQSSTPGYDQLVLPAFPLRRVSVRECGFVLIGILCSLTCVTFACHS